MNHVNKQHNYWALIVQNGIDQKLRANQIGVITVSRTVTHNFIHLSLPHPTKLFPSLTVLWQPQTAQHDRHGGCVNKTAMMCFCVYSLIVFQALCFVHTELNAVSCGYAWRGTIQHIIGKNAGIMTATVHVPLRMMSSYHTMMQGTLQRSYCICISCNS